MDTDSDEDVGVSCQCDLTLYQTTKIYTSPKY